MNTQILNQVGLSHCLTGTPHTQAPKPNCKGLPQASAQLGQSFLLTTAKHGICETGLNSVDEWLNKMIVVFKKLAQTSKAQEYVKIALREFGGPLLLAAERNNYNKLNILKTHLEPQVNFADQDDTESMVSASQMLTHLQTLKTLLQLMSKDYPDCPLTLWGPLSEKSIINAMQRTKSGSNRPPLHP